jgi:uncharacterized damage-inducible protein DinB
VRRKVGPIALAMFNLLVGTGPACAQTTGAGYADALSPSLARVANVMHETIRTNLADAAEEMPADQYGFQPAPQMRTFAQLVGHIINANLYFCSQAAGEHQAPSSLNYEQVSDKTALVKALQSALALCDRAYTGTTDGNYNAPVVMAAGVGMGPAHTVRGAILTFNTAHNNEHYGNIVVYLRLKGLIPPSTANAGRAK